MRLHQLPEFGGNLLLSVEGKERQVQNDSQPVPIDHEKESQEGVNSGFRDDVGVQTVAEIDRVDVVTVQPQKSVSSVTMWLVAPGTDHSKSLYIMVKNTWRKRLTALINTANR